MWDLIVSVPDRCLSFYLEMPKFAKDHNSETIIRNSFDS